MKSAEKDQASILLQTAAALRRTRTGLSNQSSRVGPLVCPLSVYSFGHAPSVLYALCCKPTKPHLFVETYPFAKKKMLLLAVDYKMNLHALLPTHPAQGAVPTAVHFAPLSACSVRPVSIWWEQK